MTFGERLKAFRENRHLTQEQLASEIGVAKSTITGYEKGNREPDVMKIKKLAAALKVTGDDLIGIHPVDSTDTFSDAEQIHIKKYRRLGNDGKKAVDLILNNEIDRLEEQEEHPDIEEELASYRQELLAEKKGTTFSVSPDTRNA